jgi:hypothetical protein
LKMELKGSIKYAKDSEVLKGELKGSTVLPMPRKTAGLKGELKGSIKYAMGTEVLKGELKGSIKY